MGQIAALPIETFDSTHPSTNFDNLMDIQDNLNSIATNKPLSANQGKILNEKTSSVDNLRGIPLSETVPTAGQMLICKDGQYVPSDIQEILWTGTCLGGNTISCNMSNYSKIRVEGNLGAYSFSFVMLLSFIATASQGNGYYGGNTLSAYNSAANRFDFMGIDVFVSSNKQNMKFVMAGYERANAFVDRNNNPTYLINKIIGIR